MHACSNENDIIKTNHQVEKECIIYNENDITSNNNIGILPKIIII